ncbi:MBL fold metallo-hydrolase [Patescibacteria group bacterium]|nr:MBL fold metallo-hydrolase [Patescibacteria group bacterium]
MKKAKLFITILLVIILGMLVYLKDDDQDFQNYESDQGDLIVNNEYIKVTFLDIGQGDATFIEFQDGQQMLVDCSIDARIIEALGRVMPYYDHDIDYMMITHPDSDHYGGCTEVLKRFDVKNVVYNGLAKENDQMWVQFWQTIQDEGAEYFEIESEDVWSIASTTLHFLYPDHSIADDSKIPGKEVESNINNTSIVFKLSFGEMDLLMMGDAEEELEEYLSGTYGEQLDTEVMKAGHHGSGSSSSQEFLDLVSPSSTIISCGLNNQFGHPSLRVLKRLERLGSNIWRTDLKGDIIVKIMTSSFDILE